MSVQSHAGEELSFNVNDLTIVAQRWNNVAHGVPADTSRRVLCLHGWLDNSASFQILAPLLTGYDVVAFDMAGHGKSDNRCQHGSYNIWDDLEDIVAVADALGWDRFNLLGHSRGAFVGLITAAVMPDRIERLVLLDGLLPRAQVVGFVHQLKRYLTMRHKLSERSPRVMRSLEEAVETRMQNTDLNKDDIHGIVERDLKQVSEGFSWRHDPRLHSASSVRLQKEHIDSIIESNSTSTLMLVARDGYMEKHGVTDHFSEITSTGLIEKRYHDGGHHFHTESQHALSIAQQVSTWFE